ncbi:MAG: glycosyl hydrolase family 18 protein [Patescibacteria group bacterium]
MWIRLFVGSVLLVLLSPSTVFAASLEVSGWIPYWRAATGIADVSAHLDQITEINPFGYSVKSNGTLADTLAIEKAPWPALIADAKKKKVRVIPTVMWSDGEAIHRILSNTEKRRALATEIANLVKTKGYDGIDINFEGKQARTKEYFSLFLKGLYTKMGNKWVMCSIEARTPLDSRYLGQAPASATQYANDHKEIGKYCDRVRIMAYDQGTVDLRLNAARSAPYIPVADAAWVEKVIFETAKNIPLKKIVLGIPTYGREYSFTIDEAGKYTYKHIRAFNPDTALALGGAPVRGESGEMTLMTASSTFMVWSDAGAIVDKIALAKKLGVRGVAVFKFDGLADPGMWDVLRAAR